MQKTNKVKKKSLAAETFRRFRKSKLAVLGMCILIMLVLCAVFAPLIAPYDYAKQDLVNSLQGPTLAHPFGTDQYGRDVLSRIIYGSRISLMVGIVAVAIGAGLGTLLGGLAAYYKRLDNPIMRVLDVFGGIPTLLLAIVVSATLGTGMFKLMLAVGIASVPGFARIVRSSVLTVKDTEYVEASRSIGASDFHIFVRHIIPNSFAPLLVQATLRAGSSILWAATLSFIGLGIQPPTPEWGCMLSEGRTYIMGHWHLCTFPGLAIMLTTYSLNLIGDGLRDALDPKLKR